MTAQAASFRETYPVVGQVESIGRRRDGRCVRLRRTGPRLWVLDVIEPDGTTQSHELTDWSVANGVFHAVLDGESIR